jgi:hypothetical protein
VLIVAIFVVTAALVGSASAQSNDKKVQAVKLTYDKGYILTPGTVTKGVPVKMEVDLATVKGCMRTVVISAFAMFVLLACTEHAFKKSFKRSIFMKKNRETVISAVIVSYSLTFIFMLLNYAGSAVLEHFGLMQEVGAGFVESSILTSNVIYLTPFLIGLLPAITEEFLRGFTMAIGRKILKKTFFAIVLSAFIWGFAHTATDGSVMPGYAHGVMFFIDGIVIGYLLLYFGIEVTIIWHFLNNFIATNIFLLFLKRSLTVYGIFSLVVIVSTFVIAAVLWFRQKKVRFA